MGPNFGVLGTNSPVELMQQVQDNKSEYLWGGVKIENGENLGQCPN